MIPPAMENETSRTSLDLLYHISRELTSAIDLRTVLERVLFLSMRYVGALSGSIIVVDDNGKAVESAIINGDIVLKDTTQQLKITLDRGLAGWVLRHKEAVLIKDTSQDERWMARHYEDQEKPTARSALSAPLMVSERLVGVLTLVHYSAVFFTEEHLHLFQAIADQSGIAVLNARLYAESRRQARIMTALAEIAGIITGSLEVDDVLHRIMQQTSQALSAPAVSLALIEPASGDLLVHAAIGWANENPIGIRIPKDRGVAGWVAREGSGVVINDVGQDPRFDSETNQRTGLSARAVACAPLSYRGIVIGVLEAINPSEKIFDADALLVLSGIGSLAGAAVRHAQLFERLQAANQSYRTLFDDSIDSIFITNQAGTIGQANQRAFLMAEFEPDLLIGMDVRQVHRVDARLLGENFENLAGGNTFSYESRLQTSSGRLIPVEAHVHEVLLDGNKFIQWILRDITERKNLDTMRDDLISMTYHDLRSPLANVVSSLEVLDSMLPLDDNSQHSLVTIALRSVERVQRLTNSLLDFNHLEAGQSVTNRQACSAVQIVQEAAELIQPLAESKQQTLTTNLPAALPDVFVDAEMIRRVVTNLIENACKYTPSETFIEAGCRQAGDFVEFWVKDNGPGIPASEHERIFNKFIRLNQNSKARGLGLGLAYCKLAVQAHGGRIWLESEINNGACFFFTLPLAETA